MTAIAWDQVGEKFYQTGVDRGVLYLPDNSGVAWNGLVSVTESDNREVNASYMDGVKYLENHIPGDYAAELRAFTYPDEFDELNGVVLTDGLFFHNQKPLPFGLTYRTLLGDDISGTEYGYKIHILWNLRAVPSSIPYASLTKDSFVISFSWMLSGTPNFSPGHKPTCHISIDSTKIDSYNLSLIEDMLYGTESSEPNLPSLLELIALDDLIVTDNGDGTWTAAGPDRFFTFIDSTNFQLNDVDATYLDSDTYELSSTFS